MAKSLVYIATCITTMVNVFQTAKFPPRVKSLPTPRSLNLYLKNWLIRLMLPLKCSMETSGTRSWVKTCTRLIW